jgi:pyridoxine 5-phosphate synthase
MTELIVKLDPIGALREMDQRSYPDPVSAAVLIEMAGADGIAVRLDEDRRLITDRDARILRETVQTKLILEMECTSEMVGNALHLKPDAITLVPGKKEEATPSSSLDLIVHKNTIAETVNTLKNNNIPTCVLIDPETDQIKIAHQINADMVQLNADIYCRASSIPKIDYSFSKIVDAVKLSRKLNLGVKVGRGIGYQTINAFKGLKEIDAFSIGYSIIARAVFIGLHQATKEMKRLIREMH